MLTGLDETLFHQHPSPFATVSTSDHRFFDRYWFCGLAPGGDIAFFAGFGRYPNMGTRDGFLCLLQGSRQTNLRAAVQPDAATAPTREVALSAGAGPIGVAVREPFRAVDFTLQPSGGPLAAQLRFSSVMPPHLERHHLEVSGSRVMQDQQRYVQVGHWNGWISIGGRRHDVRGWWGDRDHAWGVRVDVGGLEPVEMSRRTGSLTIWCSFSTASRHGIFQLREYADGRPRYIDGAIHSRSGDSARVVDIDHKVTFKPGTKLYREAVMWLRLENGTSLEVTAEPATEHAWAARGGGYSRGFADGKGFGARRGDVTEHDVYDLGEGGAVRVDGRPVPSGHREQLARLTVNGEPGTGHLPILDRSGMLSE